ncbi:hypothetical protein CBR_g84891 [Chara braunii]|uniref:RNA-directed DNA polymerase n=1 Tax=Chara braunii TaxID=69332 RepID=A0A388KAZ5_CHABU|nr:hypothetical protein CBR_g84891 [Chara braunii]|eukprot:GBG67228.1 hypothetical protein CBR_g84891 [Chara braunii]
MRPLPGVTRIVTDVLAQLRYATKSVVQRRVVTAVKVKGKEPVIEEAAQEELWEEEEPVPQHLTKVQRKVRNLAQGGQGSRQAQAPQAQAAAPLFVAAPSSSTGPSQGGAPSYGQWPWPMINAIVRWGSPSPVAGPQTSMPPPIYPAAQAQPVAPPPSPDPSSQGSVVGGGNQGQGNQGNGGRGGGRGQGRNGGGRGRQWNGQGQRYQGQGSQGQGYQGQGSQGQGYQGQGYQGQGYQGQGRQGYGRPRFDWRTAICQHCEQQGHTIRFCNIRREDERSRLISSTMDGNIYDQFGEAIDRRLGGVRAEAQRRATAGPPPPAMFRLWQEKEEPPIGVEEVGSDEEVTQGLRGGSETEEAIFNESDDEDEEGRTEPPSVLFEKMEDLLDKMEEDERLRREEDQRAEQRARKKGTREEAEPVIHDGPPKKKKYAVRLEEGFDVEKVIDWLLEGHNDLMTMKEILASAPRLRDELKGRLSRRLVPNVHLGTILPKEAKWAESGTKMNKKCVACGTVDLIVKGSKCAAMVDTGAEMNIIREADAIRFGLDIVRSDCGILHGASCKAVFCGTASNVLIEVGKVKVRACFFIMPDVDHGILLGGPCRINEGNEKELLPQERTLMVELMKRKHRAYAFSDKERGRLDVDKIPMIRIHTMPHEPWNMRAARYPNPDEERKVVDYRDGKIGTHVADYSSGPYASPWFCFIKPNETLRWVQDLQRLNAVTVRDAGGLPNADALSESCTGRPLISLIDLYSGYDQFPVYPPYRPVTAMHTPRGLVHMNVVPQGWTNAVAMVQRTMIRVMQSVSHHITQPYIDDLAVKGPAMKESDEVSLGVRRFVWKHIQDLEKVLSLLEEHNLTASGAKSRHCMREATILRIVCNEKGRRPDAKKTDKITEWPVPFHSITDVRSFLDYDATETRPFIVETDAGLTALGGVLIQADMEGKERPLRFKSQTLCTTERNYSQFKRETLAVLHCLQIFRNYIFGMRFILRVDPTALAYSLRNYVPSDPTVVRWLTYIWMFNFELERICGSKNRADGLSRINWDKQEGEAMENTPPVDGFLDHEEDVRLHINKWSPRVPNRVGYPIWQAPKGYERRNELVLKPFEEEDPWGGKDVQWMMELALASSHSLVEDMRTIEEGPGQVERHEDLMGGMYLLVNTLLQEDLDQSGSLNSTGNVDEVPESQNDEFEEGEIKEAFRAEEYDGIYLELGLLLSCEMRLRDASDRAQRMLQRYLVQDGHLFVRREVGNPRRVVCGRNRQIDVVAALHDGIAGGHRRVQATCAKISELYYWDEMMDMVGKFCRSCVPCKERSRLRQRESLHPRLEREVGAVVHLDLLFMPLGDQGYNYIFDARDNLSGFVDGRAIRTKTGLVLVSCIEEYYLRYPFVREFVMDRGSEFTCQEVQELLSKYGVAANYTTAAHPQANAPVERGHITITSLLAKWTEGRPNQWPRYLRAAFFVENITIKRSTKYAPATLWYGRHATFPIKSFLKTWGRQDLEVNMSFEELLDIRVRQIGAIEERIQEASDQVARSRMDDKARWDQSARVRKVPLAVGDVVVLYDSSLEKQWSRKLDKRWLGPYRIVRVGDFGAYQIEELNRAEWKDWVFGTRLKKFVAREEDPEPMEVRPSRGGRKALARREEEPEREPEVEERGAYPEYGLRPVEFHRFTEGGLKRSPAHTREELPVSKGSLRELETHLDISQWRASPQDEKHEEQVEGVPQEEVPQEEVP